MKKKLMVRAAEQKDIKSFRTSAMNTLETMKMDAIRAEIKTVKTGLFGVSESKKVVSEAVADKKLVIGKTYSCGYRKFNWKAKFLGYGNEDDTPNPKYKSIDDVFSEFDVKNLKELEAKEKEENRTYQIWDENGDVYGVYLFKGSWRVGSSADIHRVNDVA